MRNRWKRLAAVLGAAALVVCQNGIIEVKAAELPAAEQTTVQDAVGEGTEAAGESTEAADVQAEGPETEAAEGVEGENNAAEPQSREVSEGNYLARAEELKWRNNDMGFGYASFKIPNEKGTAKYKVDLWCNGKYYKTVYRDAFGDREKGEEVKLFLVHEIDESGTYKIQVSTFDLNGTPQNEGQGIPDDLRDRKRNTGYIEGFG